jgi:hypothetical protein
VALGVKLIAETPSTELRRDGGGDVGRRGGGGGDLMRLGDWPNSLRGGGDLWLLRLIGAGDRRRLADGGGER